MLLISFGWYAGVALLLWLGGRLLLAR